MGNRNLSIEEIRQKLILITNVLNTIPTKEKDNLMNLGTCISQLENSIQALYAYTLPAQAEDGKNESK